MYKKILVPLDGSKLAECALPHAEGLAKGCSDVAEIVLVSVTERVQGYRPISDASQPMGERLAPEAIGKKERQAKRYLDRIAKAIEAKGIRVQTEVLLGNPAEEITIYSEHPGCDIIVMSSHGRSGPSRWAHGSVADKVLRSSRVPVLMVIAPGCEGSV
jgi:nucleotide-binding universal stress UspA family protein